MRFLVQEERQVALLSVRTYAREHLACPREADGYHRVRVTSGRLLVARPDGCIREVSSGIQVRTYGTFDAVIQNKYVVRRYSKDTLRLQTGVVLIQEILVEDVVLLQGSEGVCKMGVILPTLSRCCL